MDATDRRTKLASLRSQIGKIEAQIREIEGPDRCEVCVYGVPDAAVILCARYPHRVEVDRSRWCGEFKRRPE